ncbi:riboflavin kinase [Priestia aryabhattai]|uniref:riboflavin kinase n=3 Tax=Priestia TaxID=2800373 RepID=UPI00310182DC
MTVPEMCKPIFLKGKVIHGRKIGRAINFPTANLHINQESLTGLSGGVYGVEVYHKGSMYYGVMNIGIRPTFKEIVPSVSYEVHILDFNQEIYGDSLSIKIIFFIRDEIAFKSKYQLIQQLNDDVEKVVKIRDERFKKV